MAINKSEMGVDKMVKNYMIPEEEEFVKQRLNYLNIKTEEINKKYELSNPDKSFHSWWLIETREEGIPEYGQVLKEKRELAKRVYERKNQKSKISDESFNAPVTTNYEKWRKNTNRYDFPGVDTIPRKTRVKRIERYRKSAEKKGAFSEIINSGKTAEQMNAQGWFEPNYKTIQLSKGRHFPQHTRTFAHELSHSLDWHLGKTMNIKSSSGHSFGITALFEKEAPEELQRAMTWTRDIKGERTKKWAANNYEKTAQFVANYMFQKRTMKREFKKLSNLMEREIIPKILKE